MRPKAAIRPSRESHIDCDTIPFFWLYASRFILFDNIFATEDTPSTPNAIAMIAGQAGETQWVKHGPNGESYTVGNHSSTTQGPPLVNDPQPFWGSQFDTTIVDKQPAGPKENYADTNIASNLTFASLPLTFLGRHVAKAILQDRNPAFDLADVSQDLPFIQAKHGRPIHWRWYQEGYDLEPTDTGAATHNSYVSHHQGPQYFGYIANNPAFRGNLRGLNGFFVDVKNNALPFEGAVFYIRGGFTNIVKEIPYVNPATPAAEAQAIVAAKAGDDDHPSYSDRQISESMAARAINAIAKNRELWEHSAIVITYDEESPTAIETLRDEIILLRAADFVRKNKEMCFGMSASAVRIMASPAIIAGKMGTNQSRDQWRKTVTVDQRGEISSCIAELQ